MKELKNATMKTKKSTRDLLKKDRIYELETYDAIIIRWHDLLKEAGLLHYWPKRYENEQYEVLP